MRKVEVEQAHENALQNPNAAIPYFLRVLPLLLAWVLAELYVGGKFIKLIPFNFLRIGLYIRIFRVMYALIEDIVCVFKDGCDTGNLEKILDRYGSRIR